MNSIISLGKLVSSPGRLSKKEMDLSIRNQNIEHMYHSKVLVPYPTLDHDKLNWNLFRFHNTVLSVSNNYRRSCEKEVAQYRCSCFTEFCAVLAIGVFCLACTLILWQNYMLPLQLSSEIYANSFDWMKPHFFIYFQIVLTCYWDYQLQNSSVGYRYLVCTSRHTHVQYSMSTMYVATFIFGKSVLYEASLTVALRRITIHWYISW